MESRAIRTTTRLNDYLNFPFVGQAFSIERLRTRLRRFAAGLIQSKSTDSVAVTIAKLARNVRRGFDYLRMTASSNPRSRT